MSFQAYQGRFTAKTASGNQTISGIVDILGASFTPKVVIFWANTLHNGAAAPFNSTFGADDGNNHFFCVASYVADLQTTNPRAYGYSTNIYSIIFLNSSGGAIAQGSGFSFASGSFGIAWSGGGPFNANIINFLALGGSDITNVKIGNFVTATSTGSQAATGIGFKGDFGIFATVGDFNGPGANPVNSARIGIGLVDSALNQGAVTCYMEDGVASAALMYGTKAQSQAHCILQASTTTVFLKAHLTSWDSDGFHINMDTAPSPGRYVFYLLIKGGKHYVNNFNLGTSTGLVSTTGCGFQTGGAMFIDFADTSAHANASLLGGVGSAGDARLAVGGMTGSSNRGATSMAGGVSGINVRARAAEQDANCWIAYDAFGSLDAAADFSSLNSGGVTINITTAFTTNYNLIYWVFGNQTTAYTETGLAVSITASLAETDQVAYGETARPLSIGATPAESDKLGLIETLRLLGISLAPAEIDSVSYKEHTAMNLALIPTETDILAALETLRGLSLSLIPAESDSVALHESPALNALITLSEMDSKGMSELARLVSIVATLAFIGSNTFDETLRQLTISASLTSYDQAAFYAPSLNLPIEVLVEETDIKGANETFRQLMLSIGVSETDSLAVYETLRNIGLSLNVQETDTKGVMELLRAVNILATLTESDRKGMSERLKQLGITTDFGETDTRGFVERLSIAFHAAVLSNDQLNAQESQRLLSLLATFSGQTLSLPAAWTRRDFRKIRNMFLYTGEFHPSASYPTLGEPIPNSVAPDGSIQLFEIIGSKYSWAYDVANVTVRAYKINTSTGFLTEVTPGTDLSGETGLIYKATVFI